MLQRSTWLGSWLAGSAPGQRGAVFVTRGQGICTCTAIFDLSYVCMSFVAQ